MQADEPFIEPENIVKFREFCEKNAERAFMFSCFKFVGSELADNKNLVKVVTDDAGYALYFSRSRIPFDRAPFDAYKAHLGIYGYSAVNLKRFCSFAPSILENTEKLEQLRAQTARKSLCLRYKATASVSTARKICKGRERNSALASAKAAGDKAKLAKFTMESRLRLCSRKPPRKQECAG